MNLTFAKLALAAKYLPLEEWRAKYEQDLYNQWNESKKNLSKEEESPKFKDWSKAFHQQCLEYLHDKELY